MSHSALRAWCSGLAASLMPAAVRMGLGVTATRLRIERSSASAPLLLCSPSVLMWLADRLLKSPPALMSPQVGPACRADRDDGVVAYKLPPASGGATSGANAME